MSELDISVSYSDSNNDDDSSAKVAELDLPVEIIGNAGEGHDSL